jgi:hypothetical protein
VGQLASAVVGSVRTGTAKLRRRSVCVAGSSGHGKTFEGRFGARSGDGDRRIVIRARDQIREPSAVCHDGAARSAALPVTCSRRRTADGYSGVFAPRTVAAPAPRRSGLA